MKEKKNFLSKIKDLGYALKAINWVSKKK